MTDEATARAAVDESRERLDAIVHEVADEYRRFVSDALEQLIELTVIEQYDRTISKDPIELKFLRLQITGARQDAIDHVDDRIGILDLAALSEKAEPGVSGESFIDYDRILSPLLEPTGELLAGAGYSTSAFSSLRSGVKYSITRIPRIGSEAATATRKLDAALEEYGKARKAVRELQREQDRDAARKAWRAAH
ncbi:hypothetical protein [Microbacterium sp. NPDC089696]|uniref:hypothetical protein n=1 Tax=Microbacterium sp. NPDC089696 TaxID=3364199 RepID=UPI003811E7C7